MNIDKILEELDALLHDCRSDEAETFMLDKLAEAEQSGRNDIAAALINELTGFYRDCGKFDLSLEYSRRSEALLSKMGMQGTKQYAAALLNSANACRAAGLSDKAYDYYSEIYSLLSSLNAGGELFSSYYNNLALLEQENGRWNEAAKCLERAVEIARELPDGEIRTAISNTNLAVCLVKTGETEKAEKILDSAMKIFSGRSPSDFHFSAALAAKGDVLCAKEKFPEAAENYEAALSEIELHMGRNNFFDIVSRNLAQAYERSGGRPKLKGAELCRRYFEAFGRPVLRRCFKDILGKLCCGIAGEGSECLGFDDHISADHDYGPSFIIWTDDETFEKYGEELARAYDLLPKTYMGYTRKTTLHGADRTGVMRISDFMKKFTGVSAVPESESEWLCTDDSKLLCAVNGEIFVDFSGEFSEMRRKILKQQPEQIRLKKLAQQLGLMAQSGQYNYPRCLERGEIAAAFTALSDFMTSAMRAAHILNRRYAPYEKWLCRSARGLPVLSETGELASEIAARPCTALSENTDAINKICTLITEELHKQLLTQSGEEYLGVQAELVNEYADRISIAEKIISAEWRFFDKVHNEGGRADCQDDWDTFSKMRRSQYYTWPLSLLESLYEDFRAAAEDGRNPIEEKYAYMMSSTAPERFEQIKKALPEIPPRREELREAVIPIQVGWMEDFAREYPRLAGKARHIHTYEDTEYETSYETYLRGELSTYSDITLEMYGRFIVSLYSEGKNLAKMIMGMSAHFYGYASLDDAENALT